MWEYWGNYGISALIFAIDHVLNGQKAKSEYIEKPLMSSQIGNNELTEEEISRKEIEKAIMVEQQWINIGKQRGLPETII